MDGEFCHVEKFCHGENICHAELREEHWAGQPFIFSCPGSSIHVGRTVGWNVCFVAFLPKWCESMSECSPTDMTLVSDDTYWRLYWCDSGKWGYWWLWWWRWWKLSCDKSYLVIKVRIVKTSEKEWWLVMFCLWWCFIWNFKKPFSGAVLRARQQISEGNGLQTFRSKIWVEFRILNLYNFEKSWNFDLIELKWVEWEFEFL